MGIKEGVLALADELEAFEDGDCEECIAYGKPECKGHLSCAEIIARYSARKVREAVERDGEGATTVSAYDLLSDEDRDAIAWVREHGGVNALSRGFQDADNRRIELCSSLDIDLETGWADAMIAMRRRLMPEGMEWPKVDGKPVDFKTAYGPSLGVLEAVSIYNNGACEVMSHDGIVKSAKDIHIVKPKVLDADGVEIREGDVLYSVETGDYVVVGSIEPGNPWFAITDGALQHCAKFTHRAPVFAADGMPLREGEHVYHVETGAELVVKGLPKPGEYQAVVVFALPTSPASHLTSFDPDLLTHERPVLDADGVPIKEGDTAWDIETGCRRTVRAVNDNETVEFDGYENRGWFGKFLTHAKPDLDTWELIEEDATKNPFDYCKDVGHRLDTCENSEAYKARDLVRRAKALAERGER